MTEFKDLVLSLGLSDLRAMGHFLTWWDSNISNPKFRKLDRVLINSAWHSSFPGSSANFLSRGLSDHCPAATSLGLDFKGGFKPFQFFNYLLEHPDFLKVLNSVVGDIHLKVNEARTALSDFQNLMSFTRGEIREEQDLIAKFSEALSIEEKFLKQKSRIHWLKNGDSNNRFFFNSCRARWNTNKILSLINSDGHTVTSHVDMAVVVTFYFKNVLGNAIEVDNFPDYLNFPMISDSAAERLCDPFSTQDVLNTMKSMAKIDVRFRMGSLWNFS
ncbi:uncharacterized protein LOC141701995 [Apium graveolens]|uniref:uncharacterized protein LOC141701995 n=1 Tax=Apium graveolens TaxID=4045 RepID=UPI003D79E49F